MFCLPIKKLTKIKVGTIGKFQKSRVDWPGNHKNLGGEDWEIAKLHMGRIRKFQNQGKKDWEITKYHVGRIEKFQKLRWVGLRNYKN